MPLRTAVVPVLCVALFALASRERAAATQLHGQVVTEDQRYYLPPPGWMRLFCVGYNEAAADLVWIRTLIYFGGMMRLSQDASSEAGRAGYTLRYMSTVTRLDPRFRGAYVRGASLTMFQQGGAPTKKSVLAAITLLEQGVREFPEDGEIAFSLGFMHYNELLPFLPDDPDHPDRVREREIGTRILRRASTLPGAPPYASLLSSTLLQKSGLEDLVVEHLRQLLVAETDPLIRKDLEQRLRKALGEAAERDIQATREQQRLWQRDLPFIPFDLYLLLGGPVSSTAESLDPLAPSASALSLAADDLQDGPEPFSREP